MGCQEVAHTTSAYISLAKDLVTWSDLTVTEDIAIYARMTQRVASELLPMSEEDLRMILQLRGRIHWV